MNPVQLDQEQRREDLTKAKLAAEQHHQVPLATNLTVPVFHDEKKVVDDMLDNSIIHTTQKVVNEKIDDVKQTLADKTNSVRSTVNEAVYGGDREYDEGKRKANEVMDHPQESLIEAGYQAGGLLNSLINKASDVVSGAIATTYRKVVEAAIHSEHDESIAVAKVTSVPDHLPLPTPVVKVSVNDEHVTATYSASPLAGIAPGVHMAEPIESMKVVYAPPRPAPLTVENLVPAPAAIMVAPAPIIVASAPIMVSSAPVMVSSAPEPDIENIALEAALTAADAAVGAIQKGQQAVETASELANVAAEKGTQYAKAAKTASIDAASAGVDAAHFASGAAHAVAERAADKLAAGKETAAVALEKGAAVASDAANVAAVKGTEAVVTAAGIAGTVVGATEALLAPVAEVLVPVAQKIGEVALTAADVASNAASSAAHTAADIAADAAHTAANITADAASGAANLAADAASGAANIAADAASDAARAVELSAKSLILGSLETDQLAALILNMSDAQYDELHKELLLEQTRTAEAYRRVAAPVNHKVASHEELKLKREADLAAAHLRSAQALRSVQKDDPRSASVHHSDLLKEQTLQPSHPLYRLLARQQGSPAR